MGSITVSAPGKLMLFGEHAVVYEKPCLVTAVSSRIHVKIKRTPGRYTIDAPQVKDVRFVEETVRVFKGKYKVDGGLSIKTQSDFSCQYGFGSSSAVTVATIEGLSKVYQINLTKKDIFNLGYQVTLNIQGIGSGFDIAAAVYGGTTYFITAGKKIEPLNLKEPLPLVVGYSGIKADTPKIVKSLKLKVKSSPRQYFQVFNKISQVVEQAKVGLIKKDWQLVGRLMNENHRLLQQLEVSTDKLDKMCQVAVNAGAYGAKLSGAGGGDCMIALVAKEKVSEVRKAISNINGEVIKVSSNAEGVREEKSHENYSGGTG